MKSVSNLVGVSPKPMYGMGTWEVTIEDAKGGADDRYLVSGGRNVYIERDTKVRRYEA